MSELTEAEIMLTKEELDWARRVMLENYKRHGGLTPKFIGDLIALARKGLEAEQTFRLARERHMK